MLENKIENKELNIPTLDGSNYIQWHVHMRIHLQSKDLWDICEKSLAEDENTTVSSKWMKASYEAINIIISHISDRVFLEVVNPTTTEKANLIWSKIKNQYASVRPVNRGHIILTKLQDYVHLTKDNNPPLPSNSVTALVSTSNKAYKVIYYCTNGKHNDKSTSHTKNKFLAENPHLKPTCKDNKQRKVDANSYLTKALMTSLTTVPEDQLILDCRATHHMFNSPKFFHSLSDSTNIPVTTGNTNSSLKSIGAGKASLLCNSQPLELDDCLYVPNLNFNLISLLALFKNKLIINCSNNIFTIKSNSSTLLSGRIINQLMHDNYTLPKAHLMLTNNNLWHQRLSHRGMAVLKKLGLATSNTMCTVCELHKAHKQPLNEKFKDALSPLDCVHIDLVGPIHPPSISGSQ
ncbi:hypothetical protein O181_061326 [Austropuccinia psidii MF-1]|uniref:Retrovirus-related Pol polyprotein from transposon TNT 1-94-like beta-barrel domain-containing protein n=1 Tax=Austropuccinia psidii MF-1 TaxID=1389203 RepID=A0A9Q3EFU8_9BASI|nr:hypothetical protein [Austropuccinia psidii MF-1]